MEKQLIIGLGSGRCGTVSLYRLLNLQRDSYIKHESKPMLTWIYDKEKIDDKLEKILGKNKRYVGDVASYYLPYVEDILNKNQFTKFIILKRTRDEVVKSFLRKTEKNKWNHWKENSKKKEANKWDSIFPKYNLDSKEEGIRRYWKEYYEKSENLLKKYPKNIKIFNIEDLNSRTKVKDILDFSGIREEDQRIIQNIRENKSRDPLSRIKYFSWRADKI